MCKSSASKLELVRDTTRTTCAPLIFLPPAPTVNRQLLSEMVRNEHAARIKISFFIKKLTSNSQEIDRHSQSTSWHLVQFLGGNILNAGMLKIPPPNALAPIGFPQLGHLIVLAQYVNAKNSGKRTPAKISPRK